MALTSGCGEQAPKPKASSAPVPHAFNAPEPLPPETEEGEAEETPLTVNAESFLDELEPEEWEAVCTWMVEIQGGPHTVDCGDGVSITIDTVETCSYRTEFPHCPVGLLTACVRAQSKDLCGHAPQSCHDFYACASSEGSF